MLTLDRKVWRELVHMRGQMLAIVLVLACGIAAFVAMLSNLQALDRSMSRYYAHNHFADVFARVVRAPQSLEQRIAELPGVAQVETRLVWDVTLNVETFAEPAIGRITSLSAQPDEGLNRLVVRAGRLPEPGRDREVAVIEAFATAHGLGPGDELEALINGRQERLQIVGLVLSPEYIYVLPPGSAFPDPARFGLLWSNRSMLAAAFDMDSAFNEIEHLEFFAFPVVEYELEPSLLLASAGVATLASSVGTIRAVRQAIALPPAEAMRPAAPSVHGRGLLDRLGLLHLFAPPGRMVMRNLAQRPLRAVMTSVGISMAVAILVVGNFSKDSLDHLVWVEFGLAQRYDVEVGFNSPLDGSAVWEVEHMPGVVRVEAFRAVPARLRSQHYSFQTAIQGIPAQSDLRQLLDADLHVQAIPSEGVTLSSNLAERLRVRVGDPVMVEILEGERTTRTMVVSAIVDQIVGISAYMETRALNRFMREGRRVSGVWIDVDPLHAEQLYAQLENTPGVASVSRLDGALEAFEATSKDVQATSRTILLVFASIIAVGVVYNSARVTLSERGRELASLRVMGFTKAEVSTILLGEFAILLIAAIPIGWVLGWYLAYAAMSGVDNDLYRLPIIIQPSTYAFAALVVVIAGVATALLVRRRINHLDLVSVLKTRE